MTERASPPTIRDVAARAGVSTATVSRVLAGLGTPRPSTAAAVIEAAESLGYRPSGVARSLRMRRTRTFGLIVSDIQTPYIPELIHAVTEASRAIDHSVILGTVAGGDVLEYLDLMVDRGIDGLILASGRIADRIWARILGTTTPVVAVNYEPSDPSIAVPVVTADQPSGMRAVVEHLTGLGHRRIGYLAGPSDSTATAIRRAGFRESCRTAGLDPGRCPELEAGLDVPAGAGAIRRLLEIDPRVTAVAAYNDLLAIGAIQALHEAGATVPGDLSVVGFDDIPAATWVTPTLTTVRQETRELGSLAVARLLALVDGSRPAVPGEIVRVPAPLVVRESTGVPREREVWKR